MVCPGFILRAWSPSSNCVAHNEKMSEHEKNCWPLGFTSTHRSTEKVPVGILLERYHNERDAFLQRIFAFYVMWAQVNECEFKCQSNEWSQRGSPHAHIFLQEPSRDFGLAIHQNDHQARRRFVEWAQNEIAVVPDFHKRILLSDEAHFWLNGYVTKQNCRICSEANPQVYVEKPLHPEKLTVWCALWAGGNLLQKR
ncbi:uncharacterized protein TNCV_4562201 [Trichonephila clavipes]|nr:uncharacterized protein TNCV_4562201 [Trichonephila clavipes]